MTLRLFALLLLFPGALHADTYPRQPGVDVLHYVFRLTLSDSSSEIAGETTITVKFLRDAVAGIRPGSHVAVAGDRHDGAVGAARRPDRRARPGVGQHPFHARQQPAAPDPAAASMPAGDFTFTIRYRGTPAAGLRIGNNMHGERTFFGENWPNLVRHWLPMIDHPYDKATGEFIVTAPSHYQVVANGLLIEELDLPGNQRRTHWKQSVPIASWLHTIAVARFSSHLAGTVDGIPIQTWVFPQDRDAGRQLFEDQSRRALLFFSSQIGPYPYEKLANVQATGFTGGTEYASAIFYGEKGVSAGRGPVVHEIAHQWFGDSVTERDWDDVWLSEGFATYFALLFTEHDEGRDAFVDGLKRSRVQVLQLEQKLAGRPGRASQPRGHEQGAEQPRLPEGRHGCCTCCGRRSAPTHFWAAIREYYRRYRDGNASTADLRAVFEQVSGKPLEWFFTQWLTRPGRAEARGIVALRRGQETGRGHAGADTGQRAVSHQG